MTITQIHHMVNSSPAHIHGNTISHKASGSKVQMDGSDSIKASD